jgi:predicted AAA+ superfamily ATPase
MDRRVYLRAITKNIKKVLFSGKIISKLLKLLSLQTGSEVSINELGKQMHLSSQTVHKYIDLLEKSFIIFSLQAYSGNLRKEISKSHKIYFYDLGIRNAIINNFNTVDNRTDVGVLWENFCIIERMKYNQQNMKLVNKYFWRTYQGEEIDYIEEKDGKLFAYDFKYTSDKFKPKKIFLKAYHNSKFELIKKSNWNTFF